MKNDTIFIVIEGLDGSGKTSVSRQLAYFLRSSLKKKVKLTFEPHDPSCGGLFIRQVLEKKIRKFSHETLTLAFAANRMDHCDREINKWLDSEKEGVMICDRYYLSSLVYQSNDEFPFEYVMELNKNARKPDIIFFLNVSNKVCFERMKIRNKPKELFEKNLSLTREKYLEAIEFLKENRDENVIEINASGTIEDVLSHMVEKIIDFKPKWEKKQLELIKSFNIKQPKVFTLNGHLPVTISNIVKDLNENSNLNDLKSRVDRLFDGYDLNALGSIFLDYIKTLGFTLGTKLPWTHLDAYELEYELPGNITQRGIALLVNETQRYDVILGSVSNIDKMADFMFVFSPGPSELVTKYYERDIIRYSDLSDSLFPSTQLITEENLKEFILDSLK